MGEQMTDQRRELPLKSPEQWLGEARRCEREGELFRAYDSAMQGLTQHPGDLALQHRAVMCLAASGATRQAAAKFVEFGLDHAAAAAPTRRLRMDIATLAARLAKDEALARAGDERRVRLRGAAELYQKAFAEESAAGNPEAYYPGINAASLNLLAGEQATAAALAGKVLDQLSAIPPEKRDYWALASEIEALLVLGRLGDARERMRAVRRMWAATTNFRELASTIRQLRLVVAANGLEETCLTDLLLPRILHFCGPVIAAPGEPGRFPAAEETRIAAEIEARLAGADIGVGYGSLAAGADILFAEALLRKDALLNVVLPFDREEFIEVSVRPAGAQWVARFAACLAAAETVRYATTDRYLGDDALFGYCSQLAMGLAILRSRYLATAVEQIAVWDGNPPTGSADTAVDMAIWRRTGCPQSVISCGDGCAARPTGATAVRPILRRPRAMLFTDMKDFSTLDDAQLPRFVDVVLAKFAEVIDGYGAEVLHVETWGDGIYLVFDDAGQAARCALDLQEAVTRLDLAGAGLPVGLAMRIGGHLGPVYAGRNPITKAPAFFGAQVSHAARVEPIAPPGLIYVTEPFAAVLALHNAAEFVCEYVGMTEAAKHSGTLPMFLLRRAVA
jgi:class 3 adenylate cyclase